jgi:hypothetical protein
VPGVKPKEPEKPKVDSGYRALNLFARADDWATY